MSSSGDCALGLAPAPSPDSARGRLQTAAPTVSRTPNVHRAHKSLTESADGRVTTAYAHLEGVNRPGKENSRFPLPRTPCYGWLRPPSRLKMNSLRSALTTAFASQKSPSIRAKENDYELTQPQNVLT